MCLLNYIIVYRVLSYTKETSIRSSSFVCYFFNLEKVTIFCRIRSLISTNMTNHLIGDALNIFTYRDSCSFYKFYVSIEFSNHYSALLNKNLSQYYFLKILVLRLGWWQKLAIKFPRFTSIGGWGLINDLLFVLALINLDTIN